MGSHSYKRHTEVASVLKQRQQKRWSESWLSFRVGVEEGEGRIIFNVEDNLPGSENPIIVSKTVQVRWHWWMLIKKRGGWPSPTLAVYSGACLKARMILLEGSEARDAPSVGWTIKHVYQMIIILTKMINDWLCHTPYLYFKTSDIAKPLITYS